MNQVIEAIKTRRSIRSYKPEPIPRALLEAIIDAGNWAPSGMNRQPWRFVVVESEEMRRRFRAEAVARYRRFLEENAGSPTVQMRLERDRRLGAGNSDYDPVFYGAAAYIYVVGAGAGAASDCPMVCQNMMLAAHALGLGSCWIGLGQAIRGDPALVEALGLQEGETLHGPIILGYPAAPVEPPAKRPPTVKWA